MEKFKELRPSIAAFLLMMAMATENSTAMISTTRTLGEKKCLIGDPPVIRAQRHAASATACTRAGP